MNEEWVKLVKRSIIRAMTDVDVNGDLYTYYSGSVMFKDQCWAVATDKPVRFLLLLGATLTDLSGDGYEAVLDLATATHMGTSYGDAIVYFPEISGEARIGG